MCVEHNVGKSGFEIMKNEDYAQIYPHRSDFSSIFQTLQDIMVLISVYSQAMGCLLLLTKKHINLEKQKVI